jgi:hypothetical protein
MKKAANAANFTYLVPGTLALAGHTKTRKKRILMIPAALYEANRLNFGYILPLRFPLVHPFFLDFSLYITYIVDVVHATRAVQ